MFAALGETLHMGSEVHDDRQGIRRHAYVDESLIGNGPRPSVYILSAAIIDRTQIDETRQAMAALKPKRARKLHWRDEDPRSQARLVQAVSQLDVGHTIVVRAQIAGERQERQRRLCMERLLPELFKVGVTEVIFESRGAADDKKDMNLVQALRSKKVITASLRASHLPGPSEPLLWIADVVCGAVSEEQRGMEANFAEFKPAATMHYL